jgi:uncharacterized protein with PQ loop repeat
MGDMDDVVVVLFQKGGTWMIELLPVFAYKIAPTAATFLISIAYLPQIIKTFKTKSVGDLSLGFWLLINAFLFCMWSNSLAVLIETGRLGYFITETINWALAAIVLGQILYYRRKDVK